MKFLIFLCVATFLTVVANCKTLPDFKLCHKSDPNIRSCLLNSLQKLRPYMLTGIPELNIPPLDPFEENVIRVSQKINELLTVDVLARNVKIVGLSQAIIDDLKVDMDTLFFKIDVTVPLLQPTANFKFSLKLANVPINLQGFGAGNFTDVKLHADVQLKRITKGGVKYFALDTFNPKITIGHGHAVLVAKNPQDQPVADLVSNAFKENEKHFLDLLSPICSNIAADVVGSKLAEVLTQVPIERLFVE